MYMPQISKGRKQYDGTADSLSLAKITWHEIEMKVGKWIAFTSKLKN